MSPSPSDRVELVRGDIVFQETDAIVNAANPSLLGGGGVDGAIHRAAGPELLAACRALPADDRGRRCPPGEARATPGFRLPARVVVHAVGPVYDPGDPDGSAAVLRAAHANALAAAVAEGCRSVAFPALSTGAFGYPVDEAAPVALAAADAFLAESREIELIRFVLFGEEHLDAFRRARAG